MNDKKILEEVYRMVSNGYVADIQDDVRSFIEQEWQSQDETHALVAPRQAGWEGKKWYTDVRDMERHRGLEIGSDGTVTDIK